MKQSNFPARKAARKVAAANRRLSQEGGGKPEGKELAALNANLAILVTAQRDIRTKKRRAAKRSAL